MTDPSQPQSEPQPASDQPDQPEPSDEDVVGTPREKWNDPAVDPRVEKEQEEAEKEAEQPDA